MPTILDFHTLTFWYGPPLLIALAFLWGFARMAYLKRSANVSVLAVASRKRTPAEVGLGLIAAVFDGYLLARPLWPELDSLLLAQNWAYPNTGVLLMVIGLAIAVVSQIDMGRSWRIGVPQEKEETQQLVTGGFYQFSRNPIYVGIMLFLIGGLVMLPGPFTVACTAATWLLIAIIIRREEEFLEQEFGEAFRTYKSRVRRWL